MKSITALFRGIGPMWRKEWLHLLRDPMTLFFALGIPILQMMMFGFAIDTNVSKVPTAVLDLSHTEDSRRIVEQFVAADAIAIRESVENDRQLYDAIVAGRVKIGLRVPSDYARKLQRGETATVELLIDGSDSTITSYAVSTASGIALRESLIRVLGLASVAGNGRLPVEARTAVLFNPATRSPNFFVPGLIVVMMQMMGIMLTALSVVREREKGTLEQLALTPAGPLGVMLGKMIPYGILAFLELLMILAIMRVVFRVPIHGSLGLLLVLALPFLVTVLGVGLLISTKARSQAEAFQMGMGTVLPSVFLSGYIFQIENMPAVFQMISRFLPATYFIVIVRGIILRGARFEHLWRETAILCVMALIAIGLAARMFVKNRG
jgi:ABC-2 type transport system permease protein